MRSALRSESYLALARQSAQSAEDSDLPHVQRKYELAARTWLELAALEAHPSWARLGLRTDAKPLKRA